MRRIGLFGDVDERSIIQYVVDEIKGRPESKINLYGARNFKDHNEQFDIFERVLKKKVIQLNIVLSRIKIKIRVPAKIFVVLIVDQQFTCAVNVHYKNQNALNATIWDIFQKTVKNLKPIK